MKYKDKDWLFEKHHIEKLSCREISKLCGVSKDCVSGWMRKHGIVVRSRVDSMKLVISQGKRRHAHLKGDKHPCWGRKISDEHKKKIGEAHRGERNYRWCGGRKKLTAGYVLIYKPDHHKQMKGFVLEHRFVMEQKMGRRLLDTEDVHHINENKEDNSPENLHLFKSRRDHSYYHKMKNLGREVELQYEYEQIHRNRKMV